MDFPHPKTEGNNTTKASGDLFAYSGKLVLPLEMAWMFPSVLDDKEVGNKKSTECLSSRYSSLIYKRKAHRRSPYRASHKPIPKMLIPMVLILFSAFPISILSSRLAPGFSSSKTPKIFSYEDVLASGEEIFIPSTEDIVPVTSGRWLRRHEANSLSQTFGVVCETSLTSPHFADSQEIVSYLFRLGGKYCCHTDTNFACTIIARFMTAEVQICGKLGQCMRCEFSGVGVDSISRGCQRYESGVKRTGGRYLWLGGLVNTVNHSYKGAKN